jgi:predicted Zn-dependent peptidase
MELKIKRSEITNETLYYGTHSSGLGIYIIPKKDYSKTYAIFGTRYGSVDSKFIVPGESEITEVPDGIAHYLEHKMFDQPDGSNVFDKFSKAGGNANAFTSFNMTAYLFSCTDNVEENLATLLDYVQSPYYTPETVQKEQGIIGQEINMYDDNGNWRVFFNFLGCLYNDHPVKKDIAGTIESISHITADYLYKCYNTFYNLSNMAIVIAGDVEPEKILKVIESGIKKNEPFTEEIKRIYPEEPKSVCKHYEEKKLSVAMPLFMMGFKDTDTGYDGKALLKKNIELNILLKMIFGKSSHLYRKLYEEGLITPSFAAEYTMQPDYAFTAVEGESNDPKKVYELMLDEIDSVRTEGLNEDDFNRIKKVIWGNYITTMNDVEDYAGTYLQLLFMGIDYLDYYEVYNSITFDDIKSRFDDHFVRENSALSVVWPVE